MPTINQTKPVKPIKHQLRIDASKSRNEARRLAGLHPWQKNMVVHHKDGNPFNNSLFNLAIVTRKQHHKLHIEGGGLIRGTQPKGPRKNIIDELERWLTIYNDF